MADRAPIALRVFLMNVFKKQLTVLMLIGLFLLMSCTYQRSVSLPPVELPENVFTAPQNNVYGGAKVAVFSFGEPVNAPGQGEIAARFLCQELEQSRVFSAVILQPDILNMTMGNLIDFSRNRGYDLLVVGDLLYSFSGSNLEPTEVTEEIRIVKVSGGRPSTLWYARATETVMPALPKDYILARGKGAPAPPTELLMRRNARKFCNMIKELPENAGPLSPDFME